MKPVMSAFFLATCSVALVLTSFSVYARDPVLAQQASEVIASKPHKRLPPWDINLSDMQTLKKIPGIGVRKAKAIIAYRTRHGSFASMAELTKVRGITPALLERLKKQFHVSVNA